MPTYDYKCDSDKCEFRAEEFFSIAERDVPVGTPCPVCEDGKVLRAVTTPHMQDVGHTEQQKCSKAITNPTGQMREKLQGILDIKNTNTGIKQKRWLKERYNL
jgi:putative FmdB family regulatory protein